MKVLQFLSKRQYALYTLSVFLYVFPVIMIRITMQNVFINDVWLHFTVVTIWGFFFIPALLLSFIKGYDGFFSVLRASTLLIIFLGILSLNNREEAVIWLQGIIILISSVLVALCVGVLAQQFTLARKAIEEKHRQQQSLFWCSTILASSLNLEEILNWCIDMICEALGFDYADILLLDKNKNIYLAASNVPGNIPGPDNYPVNIGIIHSALCNEEGVFINDPMHDERIEDKTHVKELNLKSEAVIPIRYQGENLGVLVYASQDSYPFTPEKCELLRTYTNLFAGSVKNAKLYREMEHKAVIDELTGLYNYRYFHDILEKEIKLAERESLAVSLIMMDIDYFKEYNDTFGHPEGDKLLQQFALIMKQAIRKTDIPVRYGGDEFAVILPHTDQSGVNLLISRITYNLKRHDFPGFAKMPGKRISVSMGYATYPTEVLTKVELIKLADDRLYKQKEKRKKIRKKLLIS